MANPQKENGYTVIANEILEHLVLPGINGSEFRILLFVLRKTYGYNKKQDRISLSQFEKATGMKRSHVASTIKELVHKSILLKQNNLYSINKNWESWVVHKRIPSPQKHNEVVHKSSPKVVHKSIHTKERKKDTKEKSETSSLEIPLLIKEFEAVNPASKRFYGNTTQRAACQFLIDTYGFERVVKVVQATLPKTNSLQFFPTITTPLQLQDKWVALESAIRKYQSEKLLAKEKYKII